MFHDIRTISQDNGLRTCSQSHSLLNMNIEGNIQSNAVMSKWNWSYRMQEIDFENSRKQFRFSTSADLSNWDWNRNLSVLGRCPVSHR